MEHDQELMERKKVLERKIKTLKRVEKYGGRIITSGKRDAK